MLLIKYLKELNREKSQGQGSMELTSYHLVESELIIEPESRRIWLTDIYTCPFFNDYVKEKIRESFMKRVIIN